MAKVTTLKPMLSANKQIHMYLHCSLCIMELKRGGPETAGYSPETYARLNAGWTLRGLQLWCVRHDCNVANIDFEGHTHPAVVVRRPI